MGIAKYNEDDIRIIEDRMYNTFHYYEFEENNSKEGCNNVSGGNQSNKLYNSSTGTFLYTSRV